MMFVQIAGCLYSKFIIGLGNGLLNVERPWWFNTKISSYHYRKSLSGDKIILRPCYLQNRISYNGNKAYLYRINAQLLAKPSMPSYELDFK